MRPKLRSPLRSADSPVGRRGVIEPFIRGGKRRAGPARPIASGIQDHLSRVALYRPRADSEFERGARGRFGSVGEKKRKENYLQLSLCGVKNERSDPIDRRVLRERVLFSLLGRESAGFSVECICISIYNTRAEKSRVQ